MFVPIFAYYVSIIFCVSAIYVFLLLSSLCWVEGGDFVVSGWVSITIFFYISPQFLTFSFVFLSYFIIIFLFFVLRLLSFLFFFSISRAPC